jgi:LPS sulfotransferase NodH
LPIIERPIVILSAPRAGSTLLFETLAQAAGIHTIGGESHRLVESIDALRPGGGAWRGRASAGRPCVTRT